MTTFNKLVQLAEEIEKLEGEQWIDSRHRLQSTARELLGDVERDKEVSAAAQRGFDGSTPGTTGGAVGFKERG